MITTSKYVNVIQNKSTILFLILASIFITNAIITQFMGVKIFSLERTFGTTPFNFSLFGQSNKALKSLTKALLQTVMYLMRVAKMAFHLTYNKLLKVGQKVLAILKKVVAENF